MRRTMLKVLAPEGFSGVSNWSIGVYKIDWEPGVKYYGGILVDGHPPNPCPGYGEWAKTIRQATINAQDTLARMEATDGA